MGEVLAVRRSERAAVSKSLWKGVRGRTFLSRKVSPDNTECHARTENVCSMRSAAWPVDPSSRVNCEDWTISFPPASA